MTFKNRPTPKTTLSIVQAIVPKVGIAQLALTKMGVYVKECSDEIGWMGTARKNEKSNTIIIDDVYLFDQDVHGATTEITPEGLSDFAEELLGMENQDEGMEIWNNLKMWGHSHVNMDVSPSGQDNSQMETFREGGHDWFIRLIANKKGEMKLDLYDYATGVVYLDIPWIEIDSDTEVAIKDEIDRLYEMLDTLHSERIKEVEEPIKEEMKAKVRKMGFQQKHTQANKYVANQDGTVTKLGTLYDDEKKTHGATSTTKTTSIGTDSSTDIIDRPGFYEVEDIFLKDDDVRDNFTIEELLDLSENERFDQLQSDLELYGYYNYFTDNDVERIYRVCRKVKTKFGNFGGNK